MVAFEADDYDERTRCGWSVLVNGRAHAIYEEAEIQRLNRLGLRPWVSAADRPFWIRSAHHYQRAADTGSRGWSRAVDPRGSCLDVVACVDVNGDDIEVLTGGGDRLDLVGADRDLRVGRQNGAGDADASSRQGVEARSAGIANRAE